MEEEELLPNFIDNLSDEEWYIYDELISEGFDHDYAINIIESNFRNIK